MKNNKLLLNLLLAAWFIISTAGCGGGGSGGGGAVSSSPSNISEPPISGTVTASLTWEAPTVDANGDPLNDLEGYKVHYGTSTGNYTYSSDVSNSTSSLISNLAQGTWCFAVTAYDTSGNESSYSTESCITI